MAGRSAAPDPQDDDRRNQADRASRDPGGRVRRQRRADHARAQGADARSDLVRGDDPSERDRGVANADRLGGEPDRRRNRGDPIQAVEDGEHGQPEHLRVEGVRQPQQREPAQPVVPEEELARIESVREPAAGRRADEIEDAHHREQAGRSHLGNAVIHARRHEVRADQPVRGSAADEEAAREEPEVSLARALPQDAERIGERVLARGHERRRVRGCAVRQDAHVGRPVAHEERHQGQEQRDD